MIKKSESIFNWASLDAGQETTDTDISHINADILRDRNSRTLTLRSVARPSIVKVFGRTAAPLIDTVNFPYLDPEFAVQTLNSGNLPKISEFLNHIIETAQDTPRLLGAIEKSASALYAFGSVLNPDYTDNLNLLAITAIIALFPNCGQLSNEIIDGGLISSVSTFLQDSRSIPLIFSSLELIYFTCNISSYARSAAFCYSIPEILIDIAKKAQPEISDKACKSIRLLLNSDDVDPDILPDLVESIADLLNLPSKSAVDSILGTLVGITNHLPGLVYKLHQLRLFPVIVPLLNDPDLCGVSLKLIGNFAVSSSAQVKELLDHGLFQSLMNLMGSEYTSDCFWVLSNLIESANQLMISYFSPEFIQHVVQMIYEANYQIKKEASFFIATIIVFSTSSFKMSFLTEDVLDILSEMLDSGLSSTSLLRFIDAIRGLAEIIPQMQNPQEAASYFFNSELKEKLITIQEEQQDKNVSEVVGRVISLLNQYEN